MRHFQQLTKGLYHDLQSVRKSFLDSYMNPVQIVGYNFYQLCLIASHSIVKCEFCASFSLVVHCFTLLFFTYALHISFSCPRLDDTRLCACSSEYFLFSFFFSRHSCLFFMLFFQAAGGFAQAQAMAAALSASSSVTPRRGRGSRGGGLNTPRGRKIGVKLKVGWSN